MKRFMFLLSFISYFSFSANLEEKIKGIMIAGFHNDNDGIDFARQQFAGLVFYARNVEQKNKDLLTNYIDRIKSQQPSILIAVDQEGGFVRRLKESIGYSELPSAFRCASRETENLRLLYSRHFEEVKNTGFNFIFGPVVDTHDDNCPVIGKLKRSYGDANKVIEVSSIFAQVMQDLKLAYSPKHFPGHGSSTRDSHSGFTDVKATWNEQELEPFKHHIAQGTPAIMTAHLVNENWDDTKKPLTVSRRLKTWLRNELGYEGVIVSDDLMMGALYAWVKEAHPELTAYADIYAQIAIEALLSGNNLLIFSNNPRANKDINWNIIKPVSFLNEIVNKIKEEAMSNLELQLAIEESYEKIQSLKISLVK